MKKIIALFVIMLGFSFTASAQQKAPKKAATATAPAQASVAELAKKDVAALDGVVKLSAQEKQTFQGLFEYKHNQFAQVQGSADRKAVISETIDAKVRATLSADQMAKLEAKPEVLKAITH